MSLCQSQISQEEATDRLLEFMKSASDDSPGDTDRSTVGINPEPYKNPPLREAKSGTSEANWGQHDGEEDAPSGTAQHHSNTAWKSFREGRERFLERVFNSFDASRKQSISQLGEEFDHFQNGDHESNGPFLGEHSKRMPREVETVFEKTKRLIG